MTALRLAAITIFPIKSCRGIAVARAHLSRRGLEHDRRWMIVDASGRFVTQREEARLALVDVALEDGSLSLGAPGMAPLAMPVRLERGPRVMVSVWRSTVEAIVDPDASAWLSAFLGRDVRAVYMPDDVRRAINPEFANEGDVVSFADGYPVLFASSGSLADLNARLDAPVGMERFRPNLVIDGAAPWVEHDWSALRVGAVLMRAPKPCERCVVTTIDPATGTAGREPLRTLATFRKIEGKVLFGVNLIPELEDDALAELAVGDLVEPITGV